MSRIFVLVGHPRRDAFAAALAARYVEGARAAGHEVRVTSLADLPVGLVTPDYKAGDEARAAWVGDVQAAIEACEHWVIVAPLWWGSVPAALDALLEQVLLPGFAFRYRAGGLGWDRLLAGRSARVILTMDTPPWYLRWFLGRPVVRRLKAQVLGFCGIAPVEFTLLGSVKTSSPATREGWLAQVAALGRRGA